MVKKYKEYMKGIIFPSRRNFTTIYAYMQGEVAFSGTPEDWNNSDVKSNGKETVNETVVDEEAFKKATEVYQKAKRKAYDEWKSDIFSEADATLGNLQHEALWSRIYSDYHSTADEVSDKFYEYFTDIFVEA